MFVTCAAMGRTSAPYALHSCLSHRRLGQCFEAPPGPVRIVYLNARTRFGSVVPRKPEALIRREADSKLALCADDLQS